MKPSNTIDILYDGDCRFLVRTTHFLKRLDRRNRIHLTNIAARKFDARIFDRSQSELTAEIYARLPDGTWLRSLDAFRKLGSAVGLGPVVLLTQLPVIRLLLNLGYRCFAKWLLKSRRPVSQQSGARAIVTTTPSSRSVIRPSS
jgi:predicted DCC family thiol-disulfide oxidoreductase YuxK